MGLFHYYVTESLVDIKQEGEILAGTPAAEGVSDADMNKRNWSEFILILHHFMF